MTVNIGCSFAIGKAGASTRNIMNMLNFLGKIALAAALAGSGLAAQAADYVEGKHYTVLSPAQSLGATDPGKVEVVEFFWYGCPHCYRLQKPWEQWLAANDQSVHYKPQPAVLGRSWELMARAYHAMVDVGGFDKVLHHDFFTAIHEKNLPLQTLDGEEPKKLYEFVGEQKGAQYQAKFKQEYYGFSMGAKIAKDREAQKRFQVQGTPTVVVAGKYSVSPGMAGGEDQMVPVIDFLVKKAKAEARPGTKVEAKAEKKAEKTEAKAEKKAEKDAKGL